MDHENAINAVDAFARAEEDLSAVHNSIATIAEELSGGRGERLHTAVVALGRIREDLAEGHQEAEELLESLRS